MWLRGSTGSHNLDVLRKIEGGHFYELERQNAIYLGFSIKMFLPEISFSEQKFVVKKTTFMVFYFSSNSYPPPPHTYITTIIRMAGSRWWFGKIQWSLLRYLNNGTYRTNIHGHFKSGSSNCVISLKRSGSWELERSFSSVTTYI